MGFNSTNTNGNVEIRRRNMEISKQKMAETVIRRRGPTY
jgi:hypothetical protein